MWWSSNAVLRPELDGHGPDGERQRHHDGPQEEIVPPEVGVVVQADEDADACADGVVEAEVDGPHERVADQSEE
jgi:hypothetical protein